MATSMPSTQIRPSATALDARHLRGCLGRFATGVAVVSYAVNGEACGLTVNSFTSVSLDPPLVLVSLARKARACEHLGQQPFAINVLRADQLDVAMQFARDRGRYPAGLAGWREGTARSRAGRMRRRPAVPTVAQL